MTNAERDEVELVEPRIAVAVVTMGNRPAEVDALLMSVAKQDLAPERIVIVGNGCPLPEFADRLGLPGPVRGLPAGTPPASGRGDPQSTHRTPRGRRDFRNAP